MAEKAKDTLDVEQLITWALRDQGMGWDSGGSQPAGWGQLGTRVQVDRWSVPTPSSALQTDDDAIVVRGCIDRLPTEAAALVIQHGRVGGRPDWCEEGVGEWVQAMDAGGKLLWDWSDPVKRRGERTPRMMFEGTSPGLVAYHRAQYTVWHEALVALVPALNALLRSHRATGPFAPAQPWGSPRAAVLHPVERAKAGR